MEWLPSKRLSWADLRAIIKYAPQDSALAREMNPDWQVTLEASLLREVEYASRVAAWLQSKDGQKGRNHPERIPLTEKERMQGGGLKPDRMTAKDMNEWLGGEFAALNEGMT